MTKSIRLDQEPTDEIDAAVAWYEAQRPGLGLELLSALDDAKVQLVEAATAFPLVIAYRLSSARAGAPCTASPTR